MNLLAIDPGLRHTGVYGRAYGQTHQTTISPKAKDEGRALRDLAFTLHDFLAKIANDYDAVLVEDFAYASPHGTMQVAQAVGVIKLCCAMSQLPVVPLPIPTWKAIARKDELPAPNLKNHELAAYRVWRAGQWCLVGAATPGQKRIERELCQISK